MSDPPEKQPLLQRLKERKLVQWTLAYVAGGWVVLQVLDVTAEPWGLSGGVVRAMQAALVVGFGVTLVLAWYHGEQGRQRVSGPELLIIAGLLVVSGIGFRILGGGDSSTGGELTEVAESPSAPDALIQPSVAVLPFVNMSGDPDNEYFSDGITEELINTLAQLPGVRVPARTSSFAFKGRSFSPAVSRNAARKGRCLQVQCECDVCFGLPVVLGNRATDWLTGCACGRPVSTCLHLGAHVLH